MQSQKGCESFVPSGIRRTLTHTICVNLLYPLALPPPPAFSPPSHLGARGKRRDFRPGARWPSKTTAVMDGSGPQDLGARGGGRLPMSPCAHWIGPEFYGKSWGVFKVTLEGSQKCSLTTSLPRSYILHSTLHLLHNTSSSTHRHI